MKVPCSEVITILQLTGTCWFNALLMVLFYSQRMREYMLSQNGLHRIFRDILEHRYRKINAADEVFFEMNYQSLSPDKLLSEQSKETNNKKGKFYY